MTFAPVLSRTEAHRDVIPITTKVAAVTVALEARSCHRDAEHRGIILLDGLGVSPVTSLTTDATPKFPAPYGGRAVVASCSLGWQIRFRP